MAKFLFIRHGEADYSHCEARGFVGHGNDLAQLSKLGITQISNCAEDKSLKDSDILISSPYTRALQSASIISKRIGMDIHIEVDVHEWMPDNSFRYKTYEEVQALFRDFMTNKGVYPNGENRLWEDVASIKKRSNAILEKYKHFKKVIIVCHEIFIMIATGMTMFEGTMLKIQNGEIIEFDYN